MEWRFVLDKNAAPLGVSKSALSFLLATCSHRHRAQRLVGCHTEQELVIFGEPKLWDWEEALAPRTNQSSRLKVHLKVTLCGVQVCRECASPVPLRKCSFRFSMGTIEICCGTETLYIVLCQMFRGLFPGETIMVQKIALLQQTYQGSWCLSLPWGGSCFREFPRTAECGAQCWLTVQLQTRTRTLSLSRMHARTRARRKSTVWSVHLLLRSFLQAQNGSWQSFWPAPFQQRWNCCMVLSSRIRSHGLPSPLWTGFGGRVQCILE